MDSEKGAGEHNAPHLADTPATREQEPEPDQANAAVQGIFVYGTLMAEELLSWLLTGSSENSKDILSLRQPAVLKHYRRVPVKHSDYPALIPGSAADQVDGFLIVPASPSQWKKMDDFEGEIYSRRCVHVQLKQGQGEAVSIRAYIYFWEEEEINKLERDKEWSFDYFREKRLQDWLDLFDGMEMVG